MKEARPSAADQLMSLDAAMSALSRQERFMATVYAMNTLLIAKGVYSTEEAAFQFRQWAQKELKGKQGFAVGERVRYCGPSSSRMVGELGTVAGYANFGRSLKVKRDGTKHPTKWSPSMWERLPDGRSR